MLHCEYSQAVWSWELLKIFDSEHVHYSAIEIFAFVEKLFHYFCKTK